MIWATEWTYRILNFFETIINSHKATTKMIVECPFPGCVYVADNADAQIVVALLNIHAQSHNQTSTHPSAPQPKLDRPRIDMAWG